MPLDQGFKSSVVETFDKLSPVEKAVLLANPKGLENLVVSHLENWAARYAIRHKRRVVRITNPQEATGEIVAAINERYK